MTDDLRTLEAMQRAAFDAAFPGLPPGLNPEEARRRINAALAAVLPDHRRQVLAEAEAVASRDIRAELVCCDVYDRDRETPRAGRTHAICFWGEAGARLAEEAIRRLAATVPETGPSGRVAADPTPTGAAP